MSRVLVSAIRIALFGCLLLFAEASAMNFTIEQRFGKTVVVGDGLVRPGDSDRLRDLVGRIPAHPHGYRVLELNSAGGDVRSALALGEVIHDHDFHVVVPPGSACASACGSVLFLSGKLRTVMEGGALSLHTCESVDGQWTGEQCSKAVEAHARARSGVEGPVLAYMRPASPEETTWFGRREAECAGLTRYFMEDRAHFGTMGPCFREELTGERPEPTLRWRIQMRQGGYYAFIRSFADYETVAQTEVYCKLGDPGRLFVSVVFPELEGGRYTDFEKMTIELDDRVLSTTSPLIHVKEAMRTFTARFPDSQTLPLLTEYEDLIVGLKFSGSDRPVHFGGRLRGGRNVLIFAANHCEHQ